MTAYELQALGYQPAAAAYFSGQAYVKTLVASDEHTHCQISEVYFDAGCRNNWHVHPSNQILLIRQGVCWFQQEGASVQQIPAGGVINILPGIRHWHGASADAPMIHTAINLDAGRGLVTWLEPVSEDQYLGR